MHVACVGGVRERLCMVGCRVIAGEESSPALQDDLILSVIEQLKTQVVNCTKINLDNKNVNEILNAELERYKDQETLMLEDESRSKMLQKQKDPMMSEKKVNTKPVDYAALNQLLKDFETRFVPHTELSAEQAFWSRYSVNSEEPNVSSSTTLVEVPKELPKVSMVNSSLKKLKFHLASFDVLEPKLYDGDVIKNNCTIVIPDSKETLMLAEESREGEIVYGWVQGNSWGRKVNSEIGFGGNSSSPTLQDDLILSVIEQIKTQVINCTKINQDNKNVNEILNAELERYKDQTKLSAEQAFWSQYSVNSEEPNVSSSTTIVEVPKELPKVSMVNSSLKKLKFHLASFDVVVKERTTTTAITKGTRGFKHTKAYFRDEIIPFVKAIKDLFNLFDQFLIDELTEVQNVYNQMEQAVE
nr:hypothetical protein [Tanacetum cinerariifolium]